MISIEKISGFFEVGPKYQPIIANVINKLSHLFRHHGALPLDTALAELNEVLRSKGVQANEIYGLCRLQDGEMKNYGLRFDLTLPLARYVTQNLNDLAFPYKRYQIAPVFRGERAQKGRYRQFYQCDLDIIDNCAIDSFKESEILQVMYKGLRLVGLEDFTIHLNSRKLMNAYFDEIGIIEDSARKYVLGCIDRIYKIGPTATLDLISQQVHDVSILNNLKHVFSQPQFDTEDTSELASLYSLFRSDQAKQSLERILGVATLSRKAAQGIPIALNLCIVRGLDYYTDTVFEAFIGKTVHDASIAGGGSYDDLVGSLGVRAIYPGVGMSIGLSRLFDLIKDLPVNQVSQPSVLIIPVDEPNVLYLSKMRQELIAADICTDIYFETKDLRKRMQYAAKRGFDFAIIVSSDSGQIELKDLKSGIQSCMRLDEAIKRIMQMGKIE